MLFYDNQSFRKGKPTQLHACRWELGPIMTFRSPAAAKAGKEVIAPSRKAFRDGAAVAVATAVVAASERRLTPPRRHRKIASAK